MVAVRMNSEPHLYRSALYRVQRALPLVKAKLGKVKVTSCHSNMEATHMWRDRAALWMLSVNAKLLFTGASGAMEVTLVTNMDTEHEQQEWLISYPMSNMDDSILPRFAILIEQAHKLASQAYLGESA